MKLSFFYFMDSFSFSVTVNFYTKLICLHLLLYKLIVIFLFFLHKTEIL